MMSITESSLGFLVTLRDLYMLTAFDPEYESVWLLQLVAIM